MKIVLNKKSMLITSVALLLLVAVGTTLAYIFTKTEIQSLQGRLRCGGERRVNRALRR